MQPERVEREGCERVRYTRPVQGVEPAGVVARRVVADVVALNDRDTSARFRREPGRKRAHDPASDHRDADVARARHAVSLGALLHWVMPAFEGDSGGMRRSESRAVPIVASSAFKGFGSRRR